MKVVVVDLVAKAPSGRLWGRMMNANFASIMCQVIALWCERAGHEVSLVCYTGGELDGLIDELPPDPDLVFIGAFSQAAQLSYALSALLRDRGAVTVLGGPHARCFPEDACRFFDYVLGFTDEQLISDLCADCPPRRPCGIYLSAESQPAVLPGVRERWKYAEQVLRLAPLIKIVPMIASLGCPYTCSFCIDSSVDYQTLDLDVLREDLGFLLQKFKRPRVGWYDPNFGIRFDETLEAIESAVPPGSIEFLAESSLSILSEPHLERLRKNGFVAILPGIESWYDMGNKSKTGSTTGLDKVEKVADHVNRVLQFIPYVQANFVLGLDCDEGAEPFELTKRFIDLAPGAFPAFSLNTCFGRAAPLNLDYQRANRVVAFPFHFLNNNHVMNIIPKYYRQAEFFHHLVGLERHAFSWRAIGRRFQAVKRPIPKWMNLIRAVSSEGFGRIKNHAEVADRLTRDPEVADFWAGRSARLPRLYSDWIRRDLGPLWDWLPPGALSHDPNAYLASETPGVDDGLVQVGAAAPVV